MYHTLDDLKKQMTEKTLAELASDNIPPELDEAAIENVNQMSVSAANFIHGYLTDRYSVPLLEPVPGIIKEISVTLTVWNLYKRRMGAEMPEGILTERKTAIQLLEHIQENKISLYPDGRDVLTMKTNKTASDRMFSKSVLDQM